MRKPLELQISLEKKIRPMVQVDLRNGIRTSTMPRVPCTVLQHLAALNLLNTSAYAYGRVYYTEDPDTLEFLRLHALEVESRT